MDRFAWLAQEDELSPAALTVQAQTISPNDQGRLLWDVFFPRENADSTEIQTLSDVDFRPVSDRREWNQRGRNIDHRTPGGEAVEMIPIESFFQLGEYEMQKLEERTLGNEQAFREIVRTSIPDRVDTLVEANYRRIEVDAFTAWALGQITAKNPQRGTTQTLSLGFDASRYQTAGTAWSAAANAYNEFISWLLDAIDAVGPVQGVMLRLATLNTIREDAPNPFSPDSTIQMTRAQLADRVGDEIGSEFTFYVNENTVDIYNDAGVAVTRTKVWPADVVAAVPAGERVGSTHFAPVVRAAQLARAVPNAGIDVRGQTVVYESLNGGRGLNVEAQVNALPLPIESNVFVIDTTP